MKFDDILINYIGEFGRYQKVHFFLVCLPIIITAFHAFSWTFLGVNIPYRCKIHGENETNLPFDLKNNYSRWLKSDTMKPSHFCERIVNMSIANMDEMMYNLEGKLTEPCLEGYKWDTSQISNTAFKKWEMVCDKAWLKSFIQSTVFTGQLFGALIFGLLADKIGRKNVFFIAILMQMVCAVAAAYMPYWPLFALFRFGTGFTFSGVYIIACVIGMEFLGPKQRLLSTGVIGIFFAIGQIILGGLAYCIRDYQHLQLTISLPALLFVVYYWIIPESPRWLISQKRVNDAGQIMHKMAKVNKRLLPEDWHNNLEADDKTTALKKPTFSQNFFSLFKTKNLRKRSLTCFFCWATVSMGYYGLHMNPNFLGGDLYLTFVVGAILDIVVLLMDLFTMNFVGRKLLCTGGYLFAALCLFLTLAIPNGPAENMKTSLVILGKMSLTNVFCVIYIITSEAFPTVIRTTIMGSCSMIARLGSICASYISMWLATVYPNAVVLIFGIMCFIAGILSLILPETTDYHQLETLEDAENFGTNQPILYLPWLKRRKVASIKENHEMK